MENKNYHEVSADLDQVKTEVGQKIELLRKDVMETREDLACIRKDVNEILEVWRDGEGFVKVVRIVGKIMVWIASASATASAIIYAATHFGGNK